MGSMQISIDGELGQQAERFLAEQGLSISDYVSMTLRSVVADRGFGVYRVPNEATLAALRELDSSDLETAKTVEEMMRKLREDD